MKILVTGSSGQLGNEINKISSNHNFNWKFINSSDFDFINLEKIKSYLNYINPNVIINCCAYTNVEKAEENSYYANIINNEAVKLIAHWCFHNNSKLIHISTDYVYGGSSNSLLKENNKTNPLNIYGKTKLLGDKSCLQNCPNSIIIRTSWLYSSFGDNFVLKIIDLINKKDKLLIVNDQFGSPTYAADLARVIMDILINNDWLPGIYNYSSCTEMSWFDFALDIKNTYISNSIIRPISSKDYPFVAKRPKRVVLDKTKIINTFNIIPVDYMKSLKKCIKLIKNEK